MSTVAKRRIAIVRHEYAVPSGSAYAELLKAIAMAQQDMPEERRAYDDCLHVEAHDDEVVVFWTEKTRDG